MEDTFLEEKKTNQPLIKNVSIKSNLVLSGITTVSGFISGAVFIMVLGRILPVTVFGEVVYAFTFASLATLIPSYGFPLMVIREVSQQHLSPAKVIANVMAAQVFLSIVTMLCLGIFALINHLAVSFLFVLSIYTVSGIINAFSTVISSVNKGLNDFIVEAKVAAVKALSLCVLIPIAFVLLPNTSMTVGWALLTSNILGLVVALLLVKPLFQIEPGMLPNRSTVRYMLWTGFPFALHLIFATLYFQIDTLIVGKLLSMEAVGFYQAATRIVMATIPAAMILNNTFYPRLARSYNIKTGAFTTSDPQKMLGALLVFGVSCTFLLVVLAKPIILIVYGPKMLPSALVLQVFALLLIPRFVAGGYGVLLISCLRQKVLVWAAISATVVNVTFNLIFVPRYGIIASAWVNVVTNSLIFVIYVIAFYFRPRNKI